MTLFVVPRERTGGIPVAPVLQPSCESTACLDVAIETALMMSRRFCLTRFWLRTSALPRSTCRSASKRAGLRYAVDVRHGRHSFAEEHESSCSGHVVAPKNTVLEGRHNIGQERGYATGSSLRDRRNARVGTGGPA